MRTVTSRWMGWQTMGWQTMTWKRRVWPVVVLGAALVLGACGRTEQVPEPPPPTVESLRAEVRELEKQLGEDAYMAPAVEGVLAKLDVLAKAGGPGAEEASRYSRYLWAKKRLALKAQEAGREPDESAELEGSRGMRKLEGEAPASTEAVKRAVDVKQGSSRGELVQAFGSCLVRVTWFASTGGGRTTEFFHVSPDCRERLGDRVFIVYNDKVQKVRPGNMDPMLAPETRVSQPGDKPL